MFISNNNNIIPHTTSVTLYKKAFSEQKELKSLIVY